MAESVTSAQTGGMTKSASPFRYFNSSPEVIRLAVMMHAKFPLSRRNVQELLHERGVDIGCETVRYGAGRATHGHI